MDSFRGFMKSVSHAWRGLTLAFHSERNFRIQVWIGGALLFFSFILPLQTWERVFLLFATAAVLVLELLNTLVERLTDLMRPRIHSYARDMKDLMAGAVFVTALCAALIGAMILWPYLLPFIGGARRV